MPAAGAEVEGCEGGDGTPEGMTYEDDLVRRMGVYGFGELGEDGFAGVQPGGVEAGVDGAVCALWGVGRGRFMVGGGGGRRGLWSEKVGGGALVVVARVGDVFLGDGGEVDDGVGEGVGAAEGEDDAWARGRVREGDVAAGVAEERARVPGLRVLAALAMASLRRAYGDQLEVLEVLVAAVAGTAEGLLYAEPGGAHAVRDVDYAGQLLELEEELAGDGVIAIGARGGPCLRKSNCAADDADETQHAKEEAGSAAH